MNLFDSHGQTRRGLLASALGAASAAALPRTSRAAPAEFDRWRDEFRTRAVSRGISAQTFDRVMGRLEPDMTVFKEIRNQPEFHEQLWQYINRRVSEWRLVAGKDAAKQNAELFSRIERDFGVERGIMLGLWGVESTFGDPLVQKNHMRLIFPSVAALAWNEPRRRAYWDSELINALRIVD